MIEGESTPTGQGPPGGKEKVKPNATLQEIAKPPIAKLTARESAALKTYMATLADPTFGINAKLTDEVIHAMKNKYGRVLDVDEIRELNYNPNAPFVDKKYEGVKKDTSIRTLGR